MGCLPFTAFIRAETDPESSDPRRVYHQHGGYEARMLQVICQELNCSYEYSNPEDLLWGSVREGESDGLFGDIADENIHFAIGAILGLVERHRVSVFSPTVNSGEASLTFASPLPKGRYSAFF